MYKFVLLLFIFPVVFSASLSLESSSSDVLSNQEKNKQVLSGEITIENKNVDPIHEFFNKALLVKVDKFLPHDYQFGPPREKLVAVGSRKSINGKLINKRPIIEDDLDENTSEIITEKSVTKKTALKTLFKDNLSDYSNELKEESLHTQETIVPKSPEKVIIIHEESLFNEVNEDNSLNAETTLEIYLDKEEINSEKALNKQKKMEEFLPDEITSNSRLDLDRSLKSDYKEEIAKKLNGWKVPKEKFHAEEPFKKSQFRPSLFSVRKRKPKTQEEDIKKLNLQKAITKLKFDLPKIDFESLLKSSQFGGKSTSTDLVTPATTSRDVVPTPSESVDAPIPTKSSVAPIIKFVEVTISTSTPVTPKLATISTTATTEATSILKSTRRVTSRYKTEEKTSRPTTEEATSRSTTEATSTSTTEEAISTSTEFCRSCGFVDFAKEETILRFTVEDATTKSPNKVATSKSTHEEATTKSTSIKVTSKSATTESSRRSTTIEPSLRSSTRTIKKLTTEVNTKSTTETILRSTTTVLGLRPNKATSKSTTEFTTRSTDENILKSTTKETTLKSTTKESTLKSTTKETTLKSTTKETTLKSTTKESTLKSTTKETTLKSTTKETTLMSTTEVISRSLSSGVCGEHCGLDGTFSIKSGLDWSHELNSSSALHIFKNVSREIVLDLIPIFKHSSIGSSFRSVHINSIYPLSDLIIVDIYLRLHGTNLDVSADDVKAVFSSGLVNSTLGRFGIDESRTEFLVSVARAPPRRRVNKMEILDIILPDWAWMGIGVIVVSVSFIGILGIVFAWNRRNNIRNVPVVSPYVLANIRKKMNLDGICDDSFTEDIIQDIRSSHLHQASVRRGDIQDSVFKRGDIQDSVFKTGDIKDSVFNRSVRRGDIIQDSVFRRGDIIRDSVFNRSRASVRRGDIIQDSVFKRGDIIQDSVFNRSHLYRTALRDDAGYRSRSRSEGSGTYLQNREKQGIFSNRDSYRPRAATNSYGLRAAMERDGLRDSYRPRAATESEGHRSAMERDRLRESYRPRSATESHGPRDSYRTTGYQRGTSRDLQISHKNVLINRSNQQISSKSTNAKNIYRRHEPSSRRQSASRTPGVNSYDCRRPSDGSYESRRLSLSSCDSRQQLVSSSDEEIISSNLFKNGSNQQRSCNRRGRNDQSRRQGTSGDEDNVYDSVLTDESYGNVKQVGKVKRFVYRKDSWSGGVYAVPARKRRTPLPGFEIPRWEEELPITPVKSATESSSVSGTSLESPSNTVTMLSYRKI